MQDTPKPAAGGRYALDPVTNRLVPAATVTADAPATTEPPAEPPAEPAPRRRRTQES